MEILNLQPQQYSSITLDNVEKIEFVKPQHILARYVSNSVLKDGYYFETKNEKLQELWEEFKHENNFDNVLWNIVYDCSIFNACVYSINRTKGNKLRLMKATNSGINNFAFDGDEPKIAVCDWNYTTSDGNSIAIRRVYTPTKTTTEAIDKNRLTKLRAVNNEIKINDDYKLLENDFHNLGVCPIVIFYNLPYTQERNINNTGLIRFDLTSLNNWSYDFLKFNFQHDSAYCDNIAKLINLGYINYYKESIYARTRIIKNGVNMPNLEGEGEYLDRFRTQLQNSDFIINLEGNSEEFQIKQNTNKLSDILATISDLWRDFFWQSGYVFINDLGGAQKSSGEINMILHQTTQTNKIKRRNIEKCVKSLLWKCIKFWVESGELSDNEQENSFIFKINDLSNESESVLVDSLIKKIQSGIVSLPQAIHESEGITLEKAKEQAEVNKELNEKLAPEIEKEVQESNKTQAMGNKNSDKTNKNPSNFNGKR